MRDGLVVDALGNKTWYKDDLLHREGGPAIERVDGSKYWFKNGKLHREDGPAAERADGLMCWYFNGELLGWGLSDFWCLWDLLTPEQRGNPTLLKWMPR